MYEFIENIGIDIWIVFFGLLFFASIMCRIIFRDKRTDDETGIEFSKSLELSRETESGIDRSKETIARVEDRIDKCSNSVEQLERENKRIEQSVRESQRIIEEIKKQRIEE